MSAFLSQQFVEIDLMKKFNVTAITLALASVCGSSAFAGAITSPAANAETKYAVESLVATTDITLPPIVYTMGVARSTAQDFTVILTPSAGAVFTAASCAAALPTVAGGGGAATVSQKRSSASECAYEVDVTTAFTTATTLTFTGLVFDSHGLNVVGATAGITLALKDLGETAFIDNTGTLSRSVALSGNALTLVAVADTATITNVNDASGPLFGFLPNGTAPADTATVAAAKFVIRNNNDGTNTWLKPDGVTPWNNVVDGTNIAVTISGNFAQLAANGFTAVSAVGPAIVTTVAGSTATFSVVPTNTGVNGTSTDITTSFTTARTASMGTTRTFGVSAVGDVIVGADVTLSGNSAWWVWGANASQLMTPYFSNNSIFLSRFFLLNTGSTSVTYSADCYSETGNAVTYGANRTGTLSANGMTTVASNTICTFAGAPRGSIIFTVNAPINTVKGSYQYIDPISLNGVVTPLVRPYNQANTTE
jgi:hypothetical protein